MSLLDRLKNVPGPILVLHITAKFLFGLGLGILLNFTRKILCKVYQLPVKEFLLKESYTYTTKLILPIQIIL